MPAYNNNSTKIQRIEYLEELERLLIDAVKRQLISDVPLGLLLSGGIDSSLITAIASRSVNNVKTFTITFPGFSEFDESKYMEEYTFIRDQLLNIERNRGYTAWMTDAKKSIKQEDFRKEVY